MTLAILAEGISPGALVTALEPFVPGAWALEAQKTHLGALAVAGAPLGGGGTWSVVGCPLADPWGVPGSPYHVDVLAASFERYGPAAVQLATGPFIALDTRAGTVVRAMSGIVPVFCSQAGPWIVGTSAHAVGALSGAPAVRVPPGSSLGPGGATANWGAVLPCSSSVDIPWRWVDATVAERVAKLGSLPSLPFVDGARVGPDDTAVFLPRFSSVTGYRRPLERYAELRDQAAPGMWWRARLADRWLCAPAFERPVIDVIRMLQAASEV